MRMPRHAETQCRDKYGFWCPSCLEYINPSEDNSLARQGENHHIFKHFNDVLSKRLKTTVNKQTLRWWLPLSLDRQVWLHAECHRSIQIYYETFIASLVETIARLMLRGPERHEQFLRRLEQFGYFELAGAIRRARALASASDVKSGIIDGLASDDMKAAWFALGGDVATTKVELWKGFGELRDARRYKGGSMSGGGDIQMLLTLAGPAINRSDVELATRILRLVEKSSKKLPYNVEAALRRREAMLEGSSASAERAFRLADESGWSKNTAMEQRLSTLANRHELFRAIDLAPEYQGGIQYDLAIPLSHILTKIRHEIIRGHFTLNVLNRYSLFHWLSRLMVMASMHILQDQKPHNSLSLLYRASFLRAIFGLRSLPIWDPRRIPEQRSVVTPDQLADYVVDKHQISKELCVEIKYIAIGENAMARAAELLQEIVSFDRAEE